MVPTEYYNTTETPYKKALREEMDPDIVVHWTGIGVIPPAITTTQAAAARQVFGHEVLVWDNYPVNDYIAGRLPLAAYVGRQPGLSNHLVGIISNPANQAAVSKVSLFSFADFSWHDETFDETRAWLAALSELAGGDPATVAALRAFADVTTYDGTLHKTQAPVLRERLEAFWRAWETGDTDQAVAGLRPYLESLAEAPEVIRAGVTDPRFAPEAAAWLDATTLWARAGLAAVDMLAAQAKGDGSAAWRHRQEIQPLVEQATAIRDTRLPHRNTYPQIADGVLDVFLSKARAANDRWLGLTGSRVSPVTTLGTYQDNVPARMVDGDLTTFYWSNAAPKAGDHVGVDLGAVRTIGDVAVLMTKPGSPNDYIRQGVLEYSVDGRTWQTLTTGTTPEVRATAPEGSEARYVRYRATADNGGYWLAVRELVVEVLDDDTPVYSVTGAPPPASGSTLASVADGRVDTWYRAGATPAEGDALTMTASRARPLDRLIVLSTPGTRATVRVRDTDGSWHTVGSLADGYTELTVPTSGGVDAVRLVWEPGSPAPGIAEVIFRYADVPPADLAFDPAEVSVERGEAVTVAVRLGSTRTSDVTGTVTVGSAPGLQVEPASTEVTVPRGADRVVEVTISTTDDAETGARQLPVRFATTDGKEVSGVLTVHVWPATSDTNVALGKPVTASGVEPTTQHVPENAVDGDLDTRWASGYDDASWLTVDLGASTHLGRAVLRWEAAYGEAYRLEVSDDNETWRTVATVEDSDGGVDEIWLDARGRYVRFQGVRRGTQWGYSLWELELYPVR
jgi:hyaluronoglucosaminidase